LVTASPITPNAKVNIKPMYSIGMRWWIGGFFTLLIILFTLIVWREQKSGGACYEQRNSQNTENPKFEAV
jgi:hypothetical protein